MNGNCLLFGRQFFILNDSLGGLRFGKDGDGNYGYYGDDDILIPFSSGLSIENIQYTTKAMGTDNTYVYTLELNQENPKAILVDVEYYNMTQGYTELYSFSDGSNFALLNGTLEIGTNPYNISYDETTNSVSIKNRFTYDTNTYKICVIY